MVDRSKEDNEAKHNGRSFGAMWGLDAHLDEAAFSTKRNLCSTRLHRVIKSRFIEDAWDAWLFLGMHLARNELVVVQWCLIVQTYVVNQCFIYEKNSQSIDSRLLSLSSLSPQIIALLFSLNGRVLSGQDFPDLSESIRWCRLNLHFQRFRLPYQRLQVLERIFQRITNSSFGWSKLATTTTLAGLLVVAASVC